MKKSYLILLVLLSMGTLKVFAQKQASPIANFISTSDIHFNPFYDPTLLPRLLKADHKEWPGIFASSTVTKPNGYNADSNYPLFMSALAAMKKQEPAPKLVLISGDFLCHSFQSTYRSIHGNSDSLDLFITKTINFMAMEFDRTFPATVILPELGNNDSFCGDYEIAPANGFLGIFAKAWVPLQRNHNKAIDADFIKSFSKGGYYIFPLRNGPGGKVVLLNTIFFATHYTDCGEPTAIPAKAELAWLGNILKQSNATKTKLWLLDHIPPGININPTVNAPASTCAQNTSLMWLSPYNEIFIGLMRKYAPIIKASFSGHTHMDEFRVLYDGKVPVSFIHITPAVSPLFDNNPGFETITYNKSTMGLLNYKAYYLNVNPTARPATTWALEYNFDETYKVPAINPVTLDQVRQKIFADSVYRNKYILFYNLSNPITANNINQQNWMGYWCGTGYLTIAGFNQCYCKVAP